MRKIDVSDEKFTARSLKNITGLSYRQINEWDSRNALPSQREGERGWRRVTMSQGVALAIIAKVKNAFGIPLALQRELLAWMTGSVLTVTGLIGRRRAEDHLMQYSKEEIDGIAANFAHMKTRGKVKVVEVSGNVIAKSNDPETAPRYRRSDPQYARLVESSMRRLVGRGWQAELAREYCELFFEMSGRTASTENVLGEYLKLRSLADHAGDRAAREAAQILASALTPLVAVLGGMSVGIPMYLVTDLTHSYFITEFVLTDFARQGLMRAKNVVIYVNDIVNHVLEKVGKSKMPVKVSPADATEIAAPLSEKERQIIDLLRAGDFARAVIEPRGQNYQMVIERPIKACDIAEAVAMIEAHDFTTVVIKKHRGETVYATQAISHMVK